MADSVIQPDTDSTETPGATRPGNSEQQGPARGAPDDSITPQAPVIWTPPFLVIFALMLVIGLSMESLLTQGWLNHFYAGEWVLLGHVVLVFTCWVALVVLGRSWWARLGGIFGCVWAIFISINFVTVFYRLYRLDPSSPIPAHLNVAFGCALLGAYICLSVDHVPLENWDAWFFRLTLIAGIVISLVAYVITPSETRSLSMIESTIAATALVLCVLVWWARPSCWKTQPGPAFLLGASPALILLLSIPNLANGETNFFLSQVSLLCLLLGLVRILQGERRQAY